MSAMTKVAGVLGCACILLGGAPAAMASGGRPPGTSAAAPTASGGAGGGGGGGGAARGGANDVAPAPPPAPPPLPPVAPCATLTSVSAPVGYYLTFAAVWNDFTIRSCATGTETVNVQAMETDAATGVVAYNVTVAYGLTAGQSASGVLDNDFAPFNTNYTVTYRVTDTSGNLLDTQSTAATTPPPR